MPVSYSILSVPKAVVARYTGRVELSDIAQMWQDYQHDPAFDLARPHLVNTLDVDASSAGFSEIFSLFSAFETAYVTRDLKMRVAVVARDDLVFGLSRIFENLTEQSDWADCAIFDTEEEALSWLSSRENTSVQA